jgi:acyl dehydratase
MPLCSQVVGREAPAVTLDVTTRRTQAYAAGVADRNPVYFDDARSPGVIAPPAFCVSLEWPAYLRIRELEGYGVTSAEALRGVHAAQDSTFHRPIRPGDRLHTQARLVAVRRIRPGAYSLVRLDTTLDRTGEPVATSYYGSIFRGVDVEGDDQEVDAIPDLPKPETTRSLDQSVAIAVAPEAAHVYTECAQIWNPIHTERAVALAAGLPDIILHGTASWALAARELTNRCASGDPTLLQRLAGRFRAVVLLGTTTVLRYSEPQLCADGSLRVDFALLNESGEEAISDGVAVLR